MILVRGAYVEPVLELKVVPFAQSGHEFIIGRDKCKARALDAIDLITVHDTAGEGTGKAIYQNLIRRKVSVHFAIDRAGVVWQFCDPAIVSCFHMGKGNSRSIGIEMANAVFAGGIKPGTFAWAKKLVLTGREKLYGRRIIRDEYRGKARNVLGHFDAQKTALAILVKTLLREFPTVPRRLPDRSALFPAGPEPLDLASGKRAPLRLVGSRLDPAWQGVASHLHFTDDHVDAAGDWCEGLADLTADSRQPTADGLPSRAE